MNLEESRAPGNKCDRINNMGVGWPVDADPALTFLIMNVAIFGLLTNSQKVPSPEPAAFA